MLVQHHAKSYIQQAIAALERLNSQLLSWTCLPYHPIADVWISCPYFNEFVGV
jgi:hypothetical protein